MLRKYVLPIASILMLGFALLHVVKAQQTLPTKKPPVNPASSPYEHNVAGAGLVEARTENISIGAHLPGVVESVQVRVGQAVKVGQELFRLDDRQWRAELEVRKAQLASAQAQLMKLEALPRPEELPAAEARVREVQATFESAQDLAKRARRMLGSRAVGEEELVQREQAVQVASEQLRRARADLALLKAGAWEPDLVLARAGVQQVQAQITQMQIELGRAIVRAPVDGEVLQVNVRPGEYVGTPPGQALIVLGNLSQLHVRVDIDEHDIPRFHKGKPARANLRGDPSQEFPLTFVRVEPFVVPKKSLTGDNTQRVDTRVLQVIYAFPVGERRIYVGQQVDVYIQADR